MAARHPAATPIPNGVAVPETAIPLGDAIGFAGRLSPEKGPLVFGEMAARFPDRRFLVFGDGPLRETLRAAAPPNLTLRGAVPSMAPHWREIGLLVMPSVFEGLPMAALEAMARGAPVAAFAVGALPELLGEGHGFLAPPGDGDALARNLNAWIHLGPAERGRLAERMRARVAARYSIAACAAATAAFYDRVLRRAGATSLPAAAADPG